MPVLGFAALETGEHFLGGGGSLGKKQITPRSAAWVLELDATFIEITKNQD